MTKQMHIHAILLAGGTGTRMGGDPKQYRGLAGRPVVDWSVAALGEHPRIAGVALVGDPPGDTLAASLSRAPAGDTRRKSVASGLSLVPAAATHILVHDAARPGVDRQVIDRLVAAIDADAAVGAVIPVLPVVDTLVDDGGAVINRSSLHRVQTPQLCRADLLRNAHALDWSVEPTDDAQMVAAVGGTVRRVEGSERLHKLTVAGDFAMVEAMLAEPKGTAARRMAVGTGYDVHALVPGDHVWLCGVRVPHDAALSGHSDADVGLHALTDALLGAMGDGDIGSHFPPSDPRWRGAASDQFLAYAVHRLAATGGRVHHVDVTLICEAPKVGPHREAMRARIAAIMGVTVAQVGVKATTSERLGFTGRGEGIAAQAVATIDLPWMDALDTGKDAA